MQVISRQGVVNSSTCRGSPVCARQDRACLWTHHQAEVRSGDAQNRHSPSCMSESDCHEGTNDPGFTEPASKFGSDRGAGSDIAAHRQRGAVEHPALGIKYRSPLILQSSVPHALDEDQAKDRFVLLAIRALAAECRQDRETVRPPQCFLCRLGRCGVGSRNANARQPDSAERSQPRTAPAYFVSSGARL
jgi:hypothetical protein